MQTNPPADPIESSATPPPGPEPGLVVPLRPVSDGRRRRLAIAAAFFVVATLAGSALFVSGYALGSQRATTAGTPAELQKEFEPFWEAYNAINQQYVGQIDRKKLIEGAIGGMFKAIGDPYSGYMSSEEYKQSLQGLSGQFEGIGAEIGTKATEGGAPCDPIGPTCQMVVIAPLDGSPAEHAGLSAGDRVVAIDGASTDGLLLDEAVRKVRGKRGTTVTLTVQRSGVPQPFDLTITRDVITIKDVTSKLLAGGTVGYLRVANFSTNVGNDFKQHLQSLLDKGAQSLVLDLRGDPGGFIDAARAVASQFIGSGPIFWEEYAGGRQLETSADSAGLATDPAIKLVVLIDRGSASASEIVAGALQDTGRATVLGERSYGKGTVQEWQLLSNDTGGFRLTIAKWLTPNKRWINGSGITPDVSVDMQAAGSAGSDPGIERALEVLGAGTTVRAISRAA